MKIVKIISFTLIAGLALFWGYRKLFPNEEKIIRAHIAELSAAISFSSNDSGLSRIAKETKLPSFFGSNVWINIHLKNRPAQSLQGRDELLQASRAARAQLNHLKVRFLDVNLRLEDKETASAHLTALADINHEKNAAVQELQFLFKKIDGDWVITQIDTLQTLR